MTLPRLADERRSNEPSPKATAVDCGAAFITEQRPQRIDERCRACLDATATAPTVPALASLSRFVQSD
jgi:hypothetical protein